MLNKLVLRIVLVFSFAFAGIANATLISQDILFQELLDVDQNGQAIFGDAVTIGHVSVNLDTLDVDSGVGYLSGTWEEFSFYGFDVDAIDPAFDYFEAVINPDDLFAGIESLDFGVTVFRTFEFAGFIDAFDLENSVGYTLYNLDTDAFLEAGSLSFGAATVVPEPSALVLLLTGLVAFASRRKVAK